MIKTIMKGLAVPAAYIAISGAAQAAEHLEVESAAADEFSETIVRLDTEGGSVRCMQTETEDGSETLAGARVPLKSDYFTGNAVLFTQSTNENDAMGFNLTGRIPGIDGLLVGLCLERDRQLAETRNLTAGYFGKEFETWTLVAGASEVNGDETFLAYANAVSGRNVFGITGEINENSEGSAGISFGRFFDGEKGNGFGYRAWARTDFDQVHIADLVLSTNTTFGSKSVLAPIAIQNGGFDQSMIPNIMDIVPGTPFYLDEWAFPGGAVVNLKYVHTPAGESGLAAVAFNLPETESENFAMLGLDYAVSKPVSGDTTHSVTPRIGARYKHFSLDYGCKLQEGEKPLHEAVAIMAVDF